MSSMLNKHIVELLTESKFTTVAVYFQTEADAPKVAQAPQAPSKAPSYQQAAQRRAAGYADAAPPWGMPMPPDLNEMTDDEVKAEFPFIERKVPAKLFTYKCSHAMAKELRSGDNVVVSSANGAFMIGRVWLVHDTAQIDYNAHHAYRWLVQKVDTTEFDDHMRRERDFLHMLEEGEKERQRRAIRENMLASVRPTDPDQLAAFTAGLLLLGVTAEDAGVSEQPVAPEAK